MPTPLETLKTLRPLYPTPMSGEQLGTLLNAVAWYHRAEGYGVLSKPTGSNCRQPKTGTLISRDILMLAGSGRIFDVLIDAEGKATPTWGEKTALDPKKFVAPVQPIEDTTPVPDVPPVVESSILQVQLDNLTFRVDVLGKTIELLVARLSAPIRTTNNYYHSHEIKL